MSEHPYLTFEEGLYIVGVLCNFYNYNDDDDCPECPIYNAETHKCPIVSSSWLDIDEVCELCDKIYNWANKHRISYRKRYFQEYDDYLNERKMCVLDYFPERKRPDYCDHKEHPDRCVDCWRERCFVKTIYSLKSNGTVKP